MVSSVSAQSSLRYKSPFRCLSCLSFTARVIAFQNIDLKATLLCVSPKTGKILILERVLLSQSLDRDSNTRCNDTMWSVRLLKTELGYSQACNLLLHRSVQPYVRSKAAMDSSKRVFDV
jgi:hypothetical protein